MSHDDGEADREDGQIVLRLPERLRSELKDPFGPLFTDAEALLAAAGRPVIAVGDVVTYHLREAGVDPAVTVVDGYTERKPASEQVRRGTPAADRRAWNPAAALSVELLGALREALDAGKPTTIAVEGEEDLATLPAVLVAPDGASVVYGQPGEGMVLVGVDDDARRRVRELLTRFEGDYERAVGLLGIDDG